MGLKLSKSVTHARENLCLSKNINKTYMSINKTCVNCLFIGNEVELNSYFLNHFIKQPRNIGICYNCI